MKGGDPVVSSDSPDSHRSLPARWLDSFQFQQHEDKVLLVLTLIIGAVVGLVVVAFILLTENLGARLYPAHGAAWRRVVMPVAGALISGFLLSRYFPNARGSGIPQTKAALFLRDGFISMRTVLGKFGLSSLTLASGIALGREGPSVHVGAGIASVLGRRLGLSPSRVRALVPVGASAALAAAFNTPIAAVLFSLEEVMGDMHAPVLGSIVLSSATSWIVLHLLLGDEPLFHVPAYQLVHPVEFLWYAVLGLVGGLVSVAFTKSLLWQRKQFMALPRSTQWIQPVAGGLVVGLMGWFFPDVLGVGYSVVSQALNGQIVLGTMALLVCLKLIATATCYASGNAGGIFGPSLFLGAMMGGAVGGGAHLLMPDYTGSVGAYALVGMGAAFAGIIRVPLTSVIMIFEITRDYSIIVPLMIANLISYFISSRLQREPIYEALHHQDGVHLPGGARARDALLTVGHAFRPEAQVLPASMRVQQALSSVDHERGAWPVVDEGGLRGMVTWDMLARDDKSGRGDMTLGDRVPAPGPVETMLGESFPHVHPDHPLDAAMRRLARSKLKVLPVVSRTNVRELKGTISLGDILAAYEGTRAQEQGAAGQSDPASAPARGGNKLLGGVVTALLLLAVLASLIGYFYRSEQKSRALEYHQAGDGLAAGQRYEEAVEEYRRAVSISRSTKDRLALGLALIHSGHWNEARLYLGEVVREDAGNGPANRGMAGIAARQGRIDEAVIYYQRAILGSWPDHPDVSGFETRLLLADALANAGRRPQAQAELLAAAAVAPSDSAHRMEMGQLLIQYGLPREAGDLFRELLKRNRLDAGAQFGLADAEFALGEYAAAEDAYATGLQIQPLAELAAKRLALCGRILAMDPTLRGLKSRERLQRSKKILSAVLGEISRCTENDDALPAGVKDMVQEAREAGARRAGRSGRRDEAEADMALAEKLWLERPKACGSSPAADDPLDRVMARLTRR